MSSPFATAVRKLRAKRSFNNELQSVLNMSKSPDSLSKEDFLKNKAHLETLWQDVVTTMQECVKMVDEDDDAAEQTEELNYQV